MGYAGRACLEKPAPGEHFVAFRCQSINARKVPASNAPSHVVPVSPVPAGYVQCWVSSRGREPASYIKFATAKCHCKDGLVCTNARNTKLCIPEAVIGDRGYLSGAGERKQHQNCTPERQLNSAPAHKHMMARGPEVRKLSACRRFTGVAAEVESTTNLQSSWASVTNVTLTNGFVTIQTSSTGSDQKFYRAHLN